MDFNQLYLITDEVERIQQTYEIFNENMRLRSQAARVEFLTSVRYIERYLRPGMRILDIGAGAGEYSLYFAQKGYSVNALELSPRNIADFRSKLQPHHDITLEQGNAIDLSRYADSSFDIVLLFGPLYHLHSDEDRQKCIAEATRACAEGGMIFFAYISNDMVILTELGYDEKYLLGTTYDHNTFKVEDFPFVFRTVDQCRDELDRAGLSIVHEIAADGLSELMAERINGLDEESYAQYLRYHFYTCEKPEMLGHSNHLLFAAKKSSAKEEL